MNNRGQSLVMFVLIIPIILLVLYMTYEVGRMTLLKNELDSINNLAISYGMDIIDEPDAPDKIKKLIVKNKNDVDKIEINISDNKVHITLEEKLNEHFFSKINIFNYKSSFVGYTKNEKRIIERDK